MRTCLGPVDGPLNIAAGVTSVHDMANGIENLTALKERFIPGRL